VVVPPALVSNQSKVLILDDGKQSFRKIQTFEQPSLYSFQRKHSFVGSQLPLQSKQRTSQRQLYKGVHEVPVFNLAVDEKPVLLAFKFSVFRMSNKKKVFVSAHLKARPGSLAQSYVSADANLMLELSEKEAIKYLMMSENNFAKMIEDLVIVTNSKLKIENVTREQYQVQQVKKN
jgi:hypothetical protein